MNRTLSVPTDFLLASPDPWVRFRTRVDLLGEKGDRERREVLAHPVVKRISQDAAGWPGASKADHHAARDLLNKVAVLAEFGVRAGDPGMDRFKERVLARKDPNGRPLNYVEMPRAKERVWLFDVDGQDPLLSLCALGYGNDTEVAQAVEAVSRTALPAGGWVWPDAPSPLPCRKLAGGCPYPTTKLLRLLALSLGHRRAKAAAQGVELLLSLSNGGSPRYGFGWGDTFAKLKFPFIWFDLLHVLEALSQYPSAWRDRRFESLLARATSQADSVGRFTPASVWMEWKGCCFAQKKEPSPWLTFLVHRILSRRP